MRNLIPVLSLLLSTALLLVGHGMQLTMLPLRAQNNGLSELLIGFSASAYFLGFIVGCLTVPKIIYRAGHIRSFAVLTAAMICSILTLHLTSSWQSWFVLRFITGVAVCGLYAVIESWLTSQSSPESRGRVLAGYTVITLLAMMSGQFLINIAPISEATLFMLVAIFMALAIIPVGMTRRTAPAPVASTKGGLKLLYQRSHSAFSGALLSGLIMGSFWSLGAIFAGAQHQGQSGVTWFMTSAIIGGAIMQYPLGWLSDRIDRRQVLILLCLTTIATSAAVALSSGQVWFYATVFLFGALAIPLYALSLATAADVSSSDEFVLIGTAVLLLHSIGAMLAPLGIGQLMFLFGANALFWSFTVICAVFAILLFILSREPRAVTVDEQTPFAAVAADVAPSSFEMDPRSDNDLVETNTLDNKG